MTKRIIVRVDKQGNTIVRTEGYQGESCKEATKELEKILGRIVDDTPTPEMYETSETGKEYLSNQ